MVNRTNDKIKNTLREVDVSVSKATIKRRLHQCRGFTARCTALISKESTITSEKKNLKKKKTRLLSDETKINLYQNDNKRRV